MFRAHSLKSLTEEGLHWFLNHSVECQESVLTFLWEYHKMPNVYCLCHYISMSHFCFITYLVLVIKVKFSTIKIGILLRIHQLCSLSIDD
jgi:hypothetical protein